MTGGDTIRLYYDLHIHSALSPCGDADMTPNNIVNMALLKGLDVIAVTDHNTIGNCAAVVKAAGDRLLVVPAMEVETQEEVHMLCYFPNIDAAAEMEREIIKCTPFIANRPEIFGNQLYMDENDEITGEEKRLLVSATGLDIYETVELAKGYGGCAVPAHIDRSSYSILATLGFFPPDLQVQSVEITSKNLEKMRPDYPSLEIITNSDAHYLENISEKENYFELFRKNTQAVVDFLCKR